MTDEEDNNDSDEEQPSLEERAEEAVNQANAIHNQLDQFKEWSVDKAAEIRVRANVAHEEGRIGDEELEALEQSAQHIRTVYQRLNVNG